MTRTLQIPVGKLQNMSKMAQNIKLGAWMFKTLLLIMLPNFINTRQTVGRIIEYL